MKFPSIAAAATTAAMTVIALPEAHAFVGCTSKLPGKVLVPPLASSSTASVGTTEEIVNPRLSGLAFALDDGTRKSHSMAQNSAFVQGFFKGISSPDSYKNLLTSLYYVYREMEVGVMDALAAQADATDAANASADAEWIRKLDVPTLRRLPGLETDMAYFYGPNWKSDMAPPTRGTKAYVARIQELAAISSDNNNNDNNENNNSKSLLYLFVAHQYTRYLGDLFGGQMMGSMATRSMDLPTDGSGVAFYTFDDVPSTKDFITEWYTTLNDLGVSPTQQQAIVDEANLVFDLNIGILEELEGSPWQALWTMVLSGARDFTDRTNIKESKNQQ